MVISLTLAAGLGSVCRYLMTEYGRRWSSFPYAGLLINVIGCFFAGLFSIVLPVDIRPIMMTGFCGGFTTYSTFMVDTVILHRNGHPFKSLTYYAATILLSFAAMLLGMQIWR